MKIYVKSGNNGTFWLHAEHVVWDARQQVATYYRVADGAVEQIKFLKLTQLFRIVESSSWWWTNDTRRSRDLTSKRDPQKIDNSSVIQGVYYVYYIFVYIWYSSSTSLVCKLSQVTVYLHSSGKWAVPITGCLWAADRSSPVTTTVKHPYFNGVFHIICYVL